MKKFLVLIVFLALTVILLPWLQPKGSAATPQHQATFFVDQVMYENDGQGMAMDVAPFIRDGRVYVPVRFLGRTLGVPDEKITWDGVTQTATFETEGTVLRLTVGSNVLKVGETEQVMDVAPLKERDRVFAPARWLAEALGYEVQWDEESQAVLVGPPGKLPAPPSESAALPVVGTYENLQSLLANAQTGAWDDQMYMKRAPAGLGAAAPESVMLNDTAQSVRSTGAANKEMDYSGTNIQVEGVDEADIVKTDGAYIYLVKGQRVIIAQAYPAGEMKIVSDLDFAAEKFYPQEMYVDDRHLVVIGQTGGRGDDMVIMSKRIEADTVRPQIYPPPYQRDMVKAIIYDISDKNSVKQVRELELDGRYVSSRKIDKALYLVANKGFYYYPLREMPDNKPAYRDTAIGQDYVEIDYAAIKCFPHCVQPNYLIVAGLDLEQPKEKADINTYLGAGENIYASAENLYVAVSNYQDRNNNTKVYKFALRDGKLTYKGSGEVPGRILNQFSMDEYDGHFRIATTKGDTWRTGEDTSKNNIYVLDDALKIKGKVEDIAPGEIIYSARFMGERAYMVTFKTVDPFFVIDLKDPARPEILGALKIPGYSNYLHPYDENHIIGFGKDTIELGPKGAASDADSMAFYLGMKMAVFDVTDVNHPVELFNEKIGDRGTDSELLHNHKALLFAKNKDLLAFPVNVMEVAGSKVENTGFPAYGEFVFQGAYVYDLDLENGFALRGRITHISEEDYKKAGNYWYDSDRNIDRIIYIDDVLYTISGKYIKANRLDNLAEIGALEIN